MRPGALPLPYVGVSTGKGLCWLSAVIAVQSILNAPRPQPPREGANRKQRRMALSGRAKPGA
jgi:hypothetical protein